MNPQPTPRAPQDRPAFPAEAVAWLVGSTPRTVGSIAHRGLATALSVAGHRVASLTRRADRLPFGEGTLDVLVATETLPADLDAAADILRPGGHLALVCHHRDHRIPWARKLDVVLGRAHPDDPEARLVGSKRFGFVEEQTFRYWQVVTPESLADIVREELAELSFDEREDKVAAALALYDDYGRGNDGMQLPWVIRCFRSGMVDKLWATPPGKPSAPGDDPTPAPVDDGDHGDHGDHEGDRTDGDHHDGDHRDGGDSDGDLLLIDFR